MKIIVRFGSIQPVKNELETSQRTIIRNRFMKHGRRSSGAGPLGIAPQQEQSLGVERAPAARRERAERVRRLPRETKSETPPQLYARYCDSVEAPIGYDAMTVICGRIKRSEVHVPK